VHDITLPKFGKRGWGRERGVSQQFKGTAVVCMGGIYMTKSRIAHWLYKYISTVASGSTKTPLKRTHENFIFLLILL
jgi:hypothetical protein